MNVVYVYEKGRVVQTALDGKPKVDFLPVGVGHIFRVVGTKPHHESLCGLTKNSIGDRTVITKVKEPALGLCDRCVEEWKSAPDSPWAKWVKGV